MSGFKIPPQWQHAKTDVWKKVGFVLLGLWLLAQCIVIVPAGHRMVVFNNINGVEETALNEGMNFLIPFIQSPILYDVRTHTYTMSATFNEGDIKGDDSVSVLTSDGQVAKLDVSVRFHLTPEDVWKLHKTLGPNYVEKIIRPESRTVARNVVSGFTVTELYSSKRQVIQSELNEEMTKSFGKYHIALEEVLIRNVSFSEAFANAIEQKQVALQEAERMKYVLQKEESEKQRKIIEATGEAEAIRLRALVLKQNPQLIQYEYVQKITPGIQAIITDQKTILNMSDFLSSKGKK